MSSEKIGFVLSLKDKFSKTADKSAKAVKGLNKAMGRTSRGSAAMAKKAGGGFASMVRGINPAIAGAAALAAGYLAVKGAAAGYGAVIGRVVETESTIFALDRLFHGEGRRVFSEASDMAVKYGLDIDETAHAMANFKKLQFGEEQSKQLIRLGSDMQALGASADDVQGIFRALGQIKSKGRLQAEELLQLQERGVSGDLVKKHLEKALGVDRAQLEKLQQKGKVSADAFFIAFEGALNEKLGQKNAGESAEKFVSGTMRGALNKGKSRMQKLWIDLAGKAEGGIQKGLVNMLERADKFFASKRGIKFMKQLGSGMEWVGQTVEKIFPVLMELFEVFSTQFVDGFTMFDKSAEGGRSTMDKWVTFMKTDMIPAIGSLAKSLGVIADLILKINDFINNVNMDMLAAITSPLEAIGYAFGGGTPTGLKATEEIERKRGASHANNSRRAAARSRRSGGFRATVTNNVTVNAGGDPNKAAREVKRATERGTGAALNQYAGEAS